METLKFNVFNFLHKSKKTVVPRVLLCLNFPNLFLYFPASTALVVLFADVLASPKISDRNRKLFQRHCRS